MGEGKTKPWPHTRLEQYRKEGREPPFPKIQHGHHLINALFEVGPTKHGAMGGEEPVGWLDVDAYARLTEEITEPWEARALIEMSRAYLNGKRSGTDVLSIPPLERD